MLVIWIVLIIVGACAIFAGYIFFFQSNQVYHPDRVIYANPESIGLYFENISFETSDGVRLSGWFIPKENASGVILFCHGNAGNLSHRLETIQIFHDLGLDTFIFDYRGFGHSEGKPSEDGTYRDTEAAWQYLVHARKVHPDKVIIMGRSLGGAIAAWLARRHTPGVLIVESTFTSVADVVAKLYPYLPIRLLLRFKYDTVEYLSQVKCPVLVVHSRDDEMIPFTHGQRLFETANEPKQFLEITGSHTDGFLTTGTRYQEGLGQFISDNLERSK